MTARYRWLLAPFVIAVVAMLSACNGGGGDGTTPPIGPAFSLFLSANPEVGTSPLTVTFFVVPSGGVEPYTYAWDFNGDNVTDSNSPNGSYTYTNSTQAKVTVTDNNSNVVTASKTIIVTGDTTVPPAESLDIRFTAEPGVGNVPFNCQFTAYVSGGKMPYHYQWDFDGDGVFDSFIRDPLFTYQKIGQAIGDEGNQFYFFPVLKVTDGRGVTGTNLDDNDNNGNPDFKLAINALPPAGGLAVAASGNPLTGQAPLTVEFTGAVSGGSGNYEYKWNFGDGQESSFSASSIATHTYVNPGTFLSKVTVHDIDTDEVAESYALTISATQQQEFGLSIASDVTGGQVPFVANLTAMPVNGQEPIVYQWDVFDDTAPADPAPSIANPPTLSGAAVITPNFSYRKNPTIHFGNTAGDAGAHSYVVRCVARDALGNTIASNLVRVIASPSASFYYLAHRPRVIGFTAFPDGSSHPVIQGTDEPWGARANAAVCAHPTGVSFIFGGEEMDENGDFDRIVQRGDSAYMYIPPTNGTGTGEGSIGKFDTNAQGGGIIRLNDWFSPAFPGQNDRFPPPQPSLRSGAFTIVGSAAAVFIHELPESNPAGAYQAQRNDPNFAAMSPYPDCPDTGWGLDSPPFVMTGLGSPVVYVIGGRTDATTPTDLVQKYYVYGFGSEDMPYDSVPYQFQTTGNQTDTWSPYWLRPDTDQYPGQDADPQITNRSPGTGGDSAAPLPRLPKALYGLMACRVETGVDQATPDFPNGPYRFVFVFGGIDENGAVQKEMRFWNTGAEPENTGTGDEEQAGIFSRMADMPTARAYGQALLLPGGQIRIALVGGYDQNGVPIDTIDIFTFDNAFSPQGGDWVTYGGTLPEALEACGAAFLPDGPTEDWVLALGGWTGEEFSHSVYNARLGSDGDLVIREPLVVAPRSNLGSTQAGASSINGVSFNRFLLFGGIDENGSDSVVEIVSLP